MKRGSPAISPHMATGVVERAAGLDDHPDQAQDGRVGGVEQIVDRVVEAVDGQGVLDQVVGADGEEVQPVGEGVARPSAAAGTSIMAPTGMRRVEGQSLLRSAPA